MILTGQYDSPFVRRVAIALHHYGLAFKRNAISAYGDFDALLALNPLGKVPALELEDGSLLADSALILDYLDHCVGPEKALLPGVAALRAHLLRHMGIAVGLAEKAVEYRSETVRRPEDKRDAPRVDRVVAQIGAALLWLEKHTPDAGFLAGERLTHADIASAVAIMFILNKNPEHLGAEGDFPRLRAHTAHCEALDAFAAAPFVEG
jgi:glutathione S-transferase